MIYTSKSKQKESLHENHNRLFGVHRHNRRYLHFFRCDTGNPICTDSFCLVPRDDVTGDVIEIDESKVLALIGKDTTTPADTVIEPPQTTANITLLALVVADVLVKGENSTYIGQTVSIKEVVKFNLVVSSDRGGITLETNSADVIFYITDFDNPETLRDYTQGETYTFKVHIRSVLESPDRAGLWFVYSHEVD